jgi:RNA ligase
MTQNTITLDAFLARSNLTHQRKDGLILFDYNKTCTFAFDWDTITINGRGIVFEESTGKLVARPYSKFWNMEELFFENALTDRARLLPIEYQPNFTGKFRVLEKADGSCAIVYFYNGEWRVNTRGSFNSDQAVWGKKYLDSNIKTELMNREHTYIFEAIYPDNRIVINYGDKEALVLTGIIDTQTGDEFGVEYLEAECAKIGCEMVKVLVFDKFEDLFTVRDTLTVNEEGFVITFDNGYKCKLKGAAYCAVHKKMNNLTPLAFWNAFDVESFKMPESFLAELPEEFRDSVDELTEITERMHNESYARLIDLASTIPVFENDASGRKARYEYITSHVDHGDVALVLSILNGSGKKTKEVIHRMVRPFKNSYDGITLNSRLQRIFSES